MFVLSSEWGGICFACSCSWPCPAVACRTTQRHCPYTVSNRTRPSDTAVTSQMCVPVFVLGELMSLCHKQLSLFLFMIIHQVFSVQGVFLATWQLKNKQKPLV